MFSLRKTSSRPPKLPKQFGLHNSTQWLLTALMTLIMLLVSINANATGQALTYLPITLKSTGLFTPPGAAKYTVIYGESDSTAGALIAAQIAIESAANSGYKPISIGGGAGVSIDQEYGAIINGEPDLIIDVNSMLVTVYVLLEGPATAPDISNTGEPVP